MKKVNHGREMVFKIAFRLCMCACVFGMVRLTVLMNILLTHTFTLSVFHTRTKFRMFICLPLFFGSVSFVISNRNQITIRSNWCNALYELYTIPHLFLLLIYLFIKRLFFFYTKVKLKNERSIFLFQTTRFWCQKTWIECNFCHPKVFLLFWSV